MFKQINCILTLFFASFCALCSGEDFASFEVGVGWRRDNLQWKAINFDDLSHFDLSGKSHLNFKEINTYTCNAKARWSGEAYRIRLSADYGTTVNGRSHETITLLRQLSSSSSSPIPSDIPQSSFFGFESCRIKPRSEVYDFTGAVGYPWVLFCGQFYVSPMVGYSFHRQHWRAQGHKHMSSSSSSSSSSSGSSSVFSSPSSSSSSSSWSSTSGSTSFVVDSSNPLGFPSSSDPFISSSSSEPMASQFGLRAKHRVNNYRFTWYGPLIGVDLGYAFDPYWSIYTELEGDVFCSARQKRKSNSGIGPIDTLHEAGRAYGFNSTTGVTYFLPTCWYFLVSVDYKWWKCVSHENKTQWKSVGLNVSMGYEW